ncbi:MAG: PKD domain-containing protein, partial [Euryarchaeota archaeon]|nr:PKD domain-containing protein [Euryarchaeota archaeon]
MTKYRSRIFIICLLLFLLTAAQPALGLVAVDHPAPDSDWAKFQKDNYNTGVTEDRAPVTDPSASSFSWEYKLGGNVDSVPLVAGDMLYVLAGNNHVYAFKRTTGELVWEKSTSGGAGGFVIGTAAVGNDIIFVPTSNGKIFAFDAKTGDSKWNITVSSKQIDTPVTYSDGKIYFGEAIGGHKYYCYDENGNEVWNRTATSSISKQGSYYWTGAAVIGNSLVYGDDDGNLVSVNKNTGADIAEINISEEFGITGGGIRSSILYVEELERIYFTSTGGYCLSIGFNPSDGTFNTNDKYSEKIAYSTSTPAYYNGRVYVGTGSIMGGAGNRIYCLDANLTSVIWDYSVGTIQSSPAISTYYDDGDGEVYIYFTVNDNKKGGVYCLKDFTGCTSPELSWSFVNSSKTSYSLQGVAISDGWIYFGADKKYVFGLTTPSPTLPTAAFSVSAEKGAVPFTVKFTDNSENATSWAWDFDNDGNIDSNEQNPLHTYYTEGDYTVKLTASNENGSDIKEIPGMIKVGPELPAAPGDAWYQFHKDALHNGYTESDAPDSANVAWIAKPRDEAYSLAPSSSVAIAEEKVFGICNGPIDDLGNPLTPYGQLVAFDESTGEEVWNVTVSAPEWGSWSSPAYDSGKVFASTGKETCCVNASTGDIVWTFHNPSDLASCNGGPAIGDGKVFFSDWDGGNYYCVDENTGALLWTFKVDGTYAQATPSYKDGKVYFSSWSTVNAVYCVSATTGELIWKNDNFEGNPCGSVTVTDEGLYVTVYSFGSSDGIYKLDLTDGHILWGRSDISPTDSTPTVTGGRVYLSTGCYGYSDPKTYCLDASDGHTVWETDAADKMGDWICSVAVADGKVFTGGAGEGLFTGCGELYVLDATTGAKVWNYTGCGCSPALADSMVFSIGGGKLYAFKEPEVIPPEAKFSSNVSSGEAPLTVSFTDESTGEGITWAWDFENDGTVDSIEQNPVYTYTTPGTYTVNLTVTNAGGSDSEVKVGYIVVSEPLPAPPVAAFSAEPTSGYSPLTVNFTDKSTGTISSYTWDFDNDGVVDSTDQNPVHTYTTPGTYTVNLTVTNAGGSDSEVKSEYIVVSEPLPELPVAAFTATPTSGNAPLTVNFTDQSTGVVSSYSWDFDNDGTAESNEKNPSYTYVTAGTYTVKLTVTNAGGSDDEVKTGYITVSEPLPEPPTADFSAAPTSGDVPLTVQFTDKSTGIVSSYSWDFNNDGEVDSTEQHPSCTYDASGNYTVKLTVTGPGGSDSEIKVEYIVVSDSLPAPPLANFTATPTSGDAPLTVDFTDLSTGDAINSWAWDFDSDGNVDSTDQSPSYTYTVPGVYTVSLNVSNAGGSDDEVKVGFIEVTRSLAKSYSTAMNNTNPGAPDPAIPGFVGPAGDGKVTAGNVVNPIFKEWASTVVDYSPANQSNSFTDATKALGPVTGTNTDIVSLGDLTSTQINAGEKPGSITLGFNVPIANGDGPDLALFENSFMSGSQVFAELGYVEVSTDNIIYVRFPAVSLTPGLVGSYGTIDPTNVTNLVGKHVNAYGNSWGTPFDLSQLENTTEVLNGSVDLNNINYVRVVDIPGNGTFLDSLGNPIYDAWVTRGSGGVDLEAVGVINTADLPLPVAGFSVNVTSGDSPLSVQFTDESTGSPTSWAWDFDNDGTIDSTDQNPLFTYENAGTYTVNLTVANAGGSDFEVKRDYITVSEPPTPKPVASFTADVTSGTAPLTVNFTDQSTGSPTSWLWDFGDAESAIEQNAMHTYASAGTYTVTLTVSNAGGSDSEIKTDYITVSAPEIPDTEKPVFDSVVLFPANTTAGSTISISANITDNVAVTEVLAGQVQLTNIDGIWKGNITAPSSLGD